MTVGEPFNPYRVFQGAFAPFWVIEYRGISAGAKLCYIRLLGFAGKDGHCYPSLETLGTCLGVSERQARGYIRELETAGLIAVEQRGLRRTNVYLFLWTADLESISTVTPEPVDPEPTGNSSPQASGTTAQVTSAPDRKNSSGHNGKSAAGLPAPLDCAGPSSTRDSRHFGFPDRKHTSALDRNDPSGLDRKSPSGPIGNSSEGIGSQESSSSSASAVSQSTPMRTMMSEFREPHSEQPSRSAAGESDLAGAILNWARAEGIRRRRGDGGFGLPDERLLEEWAEILNRLCPTGTDPLKWVEAVMNNARTAADFTSEWRNWSFLTLQVQLAAERTRLIANNPLPDVADVVPLPLEDPDCEWARAKAVIRAEIGEIPFGNWFASSRQTARTENSIIVELPNAQTRAFIEMDYLDAIARAALGLRIPKVELAVREMCGA